MLEEEDVSEVIQVVQVMQVINVIQRYFKKMVGRDIPYVGITSLVTPGRPSFV